MALVELLQRRRMTATVVAGALLGSLVGLFLPIRAADPPKADEATWSLPNAQALKRFSDNTYQAVRSAKFWGDLQMPGQRGNEKKATAWVLTSIVTRPLVQVSISEQSKQGQPVQTWVRIGGKFPDGAVLDAVTRDRIWFTKDACKHVRSLYQNPLHPDPEGCIGADGKPLAPAETTAKPGRPDPGNPTPDKPTPSGTPPMVPAPGTTSPASPSSRNLVGKQPA